jgi:hypothetical protein
MIIPHPGKRPSMSVNDFDKYSNISLSLALGGWYTVAATIHGIPLGSLGGLNCVQRTSRLGLSN